MKEDGEWGDGVSGWGGRDYLIAARKLYTIIMNKALVDSFQGVREIWNDCKSEYGRKEK